MSVVPKSKTRVGHRRTSSKRRCLSQLQTKRPTEVFESAQICFPNFIGSSILEKDFKAKIFRNRPQCYLQIFVYHYLVMCFETKNQNNCEELLDDIYELIEKPQFEFILPQSNNSLKEYPPMSLKNIISQYLNYMSQGSSRVLESLNKYPPILQIFVAFFRTLLLLGEVCTSYEDEVSMEDTYQFLSSYFDLEMNIGTNFVHFEQSNIYVYKKDFNEVYMVYPVDQTQISSFLNNDEQQLYRSGYSSLNLIMSNLDESSISQILSKLKSKGDKIGQEQGNKLKKSSRLKTNQKKKKIKQEIGQQSKISSKISYNYTESEKTIHPRPSYHTPTNLQTCMTNNKKLVSIHENNRELERRSAEMQQIKVVNKNESQGRVMKHRRHSSQTSQIQIDQQQMDAYEREYLEYKERQSLNKNVNDKVNQTFRKRYSGLPVTSKVLHRVASVSKCPEHEKLEYIWVNNDVTQQFTSSFILEAMPEPYRSSIKAKKQKARLIRNSACTIYS